jgi:hypothetical protein
MSDDPDYKAWHWDRSTSTWLYGTSNRGAGVHTDKQGWTGTVVFDGEMIGISTSDDLEIAQEEALEVLNKLKAAAA